MIDAHCHVWRVGRNGFSWPTPDLAIHCDYVVGDLKVLAVPLGIDGCVLVQSQESAEDTVWLLDSGSIDPFVAGVVGWMDFHAPDAIEHIHRLARHPKLRGLRPMVQDREDGWFDDPAIDPAIEAMVERRLSLDALVRPRHLASLDRLARRFPDLRIVIDHAAKPQHASPEWNAAMTALARHPHIYCKLSGLLTEAPQDDARDTAQTVLAIFGPKRTMWGSDWPVVDLAADYGSWHTLVLEWVDPADHGAVFGGVAQAFYRLGPEQ